MTKRSKFFAFAGGALFVLAAYVGLSGPARPVDVPHQKVMLRPGTLGCWFDNKNTTSIPSRGIGYLGNGEWMLISDGGYPTVYVKSQFESCLIQDPPKVAPAPIVNDSRDDETTA